MHTHADEYIHGIYIAPGLREFPPKIEGVPTDIIGYYVGTIPFGQFSVHGLLVRLHVEPIPESKVILGKIVLFGAMLAVAVPYVLWLWWSRKMPFAYLTIGVTAWYFLVDLFLPDYRGCYDDVFIINLLAAAIVTATRIPWAVWPCALAFPAGWAVYAFVIDRPWLINLPTAMYTLSSIMLLILFNNAFVSRKVAAAC
jgi:hypothetical protein